MVAATASDVFLSYSRADADAVEAVRARLSEDDITSFLDRAKLPAGQPWQPFLEKELGRSGAVAVFLGQRMGSWQHREVQLALDRQAREHGFPVIPILLPGLDDEPTGFLSLQTWIDLRAGLDDPEQLQTLIAAIHRQAPEDASAELKASICPYRGLLPFREEDAGFFFGREQATHDLLTKVQRHPVVAVIGRSGSGKSSLVFAGLFPKLRQCPAGTTWDMMTIRPEDEPLHKLAEAISPPDPGLTRGARREALNEEAERFRRGAVSLGGLVNDYLAEQLGTDCLLLYVDQWEELYTQAGRAGDERKRAQKQADVARFIDLLLQATDENRLTLAFTVRADFYDHLLQHDRLTTIAQDQQISLGPLTEAQLREFIERPASKVGLGFEEGLIERIVQDVGGDEGKLPLLEYALKGTWENSRKAWSPGTTTPLLTHAAYETAGRVEGAIAGKADDVYVKMTDAQRDAARRLFVNLVTPGEGQADTRAIARVPNDPTIEQVVAAFSARDQRLLVTGHDPDRGRIVEVSHEALIRSWGELRRWVQGNRQLLLTRDRIAVDMQRWRGKNELDELLLPSGVRLEEGKRLLEHHGDVAIDDVELYIQRSIAADEERKTEEQRRRDEEKERQVQAAQAVAAANRRTAQRTAVGLAVAVALAALAGWQWYEATGQKTIAEQAAEYAEEAGLAAMAAKDEAEAQRRAAIAQADKAKAAERKALAQESRALAALAQSETRAGNAVNGMLLALRSMPISDTVQGAPLVPETRQALVDATVGRREQLVLRGHESMVNAAAFSPDGARIVSGSNDHTVRVWDAANGEELLVLLGHEGWVNAASFSPDGTRIVSGADDQTARVWDAASSEELLVLRDHEEEIYAAAFSPDGKHIVSGSADRTVRVWGAATGKELLTLRGHEGSVLAATFSPDGARIVSASADRTIRVWDAASGVELLVLRGHESVVNAAAFSPDGTRIVSGSNDNTVRVWDAASGEELLVLRGHEGWVNAVSFSPDGAQIVSGSEDKTVRVWDGANGAGLLVLRGHEEPVLAVAYSPDGARIVSGSGSDLLEESDDTVRVWDAASGVELLILRGHKGWVNAVSFSPDGGRIVSGSEDGTVRVWDAASGTEILILRGHEEPVLAAAFSPDGARIVSGSADRTIRVWDAASGVEPLVLRGHESVVNAAAFSPDGARIVSGSADRTVRVWDTATGKEPLVLRGHDDPVTAAAFSPDGTRIVSASGSVFGLGDNKVRVWDAARGTELLVLPGDSWPVYAAAFSPDGARIVSGSKGQTVRVWDAASGPELLVLRGHELGVKAAAFSPDGARILSASADRTIRVWDAASGVELLVLRGHDGEVLAAAFSVDGARIVSGSTDGTVRVWFVGEDDAALVAHACARLPRDLSTEAVKRFNLDPDAPWPCAERAQTLWPHPVDAAAIAPAAGAEEGGAAAAE